MARWLKLNFPTAKSSDSKQYGDSPTKNSEALPPTAPSFAGAQNSSQDLRDEGQVIVTLSDVDALKDNGATDVMVKTDRKLNYKTFRLHEPERYVIDFDGLPALQSAQLPALTDGNF